MRRMNVSRHVSGQQRECGAVWQFYEHEPSILGPEDAVMLLKICMVLPRQGYSELQLLR